MFDAQGQCFGARNWRPNVFYFEDCDGLTVEGVTTRNSGSWTQHYVRCRNVVIRGVAVLSPRPGRNNDGIDICGCQNLNLEGSTVVSDDDAIVIRSKAYMSIGYDHRVVDGAVADAFMSVVKRTIESFDASMV